MQACYLHFAPFLISERLLFMNKKKTAAAAVAGLENIYPDAECSLKYEKPYELMIAVRLSAQCTDARVNIVTKELFERFPTLDSFAEADVKDIADIIRPCGLVNTKAKSISEMCIRLRDVYGGVLPDSMEELLTFSGVGRKTANLLLGDVFHKPAVVTDTHCIRISGRLGLTSSKDPKTVEDDLRKILSPDKSSDFCHRLVLFGREYCKARSPKCESCPLREYLRAEDEKFKCKVVF